MIKKHKKQAFYLMIIVIFFNCNSSKSLRMNRRKMSAKNKNQIKKAEKSLLNFSNEKENEIIKKHQIYKKDLFFNCSNIDHFITKHDFNHEDKIFLKWNDNHIIQAKIYENHSNNFSREYELEIKEFSPIDPSILKLNQDSIFVSRYLNKKNGILYVRDSRLKGGCSPENFGKDFGENFGIFAAKIICGTLIVLAIIWAKVSVATTFLDNLGDIIVEGIRGITSLGGRFIWAIVSIHTNITDVLLGILGLGGKFIQSIVDIYNKTGDVALGILDLGSDFIWGIVNIYNKTGDTIVDLVGSFERMYISTPINWMQTQILFFLNLLKSFGSNIASIFSGFFSALSFLINSPMILIFIACIIIAMMLLLKNVY